MGNGGRVVGKHGQALLLAELCLEPLGLLRDAAERSLDGLRKLRGMRRRQYDHRRVDALSPRGSEPHCGMRVDHHAGFGEEATNGHLGLMLTDRMGGEVSAHLGELALLEMESARSAKLVHARPDAGTVTAHELEQKPLEVARKLNIHARAGGGDHAPWLVNPRL